ncbi:type I restriction enzyme endonuclease domain-containing protein [Facklamia sp. P13069]|uniref:type I restriction enzyme endonuclease domain-containing protein n=1 Tax=Facklamia sp. P13069 TaxID=3421954 RepID=UPI003D184A78
MAQDIVDHYEKPTDEKPENVQKAMIVCSTREIAFRLLNNILKIRPEWGESIKSEDESKLTKQELNKLAALPKINLVSTRGSNDEEDLYEACGTKEYRKMLDRQFKNNNSNFKIAVVVNMWITGFDVPSLAVMYIDKPLQKHTLIQTISRVSRVFEGKDKGLVVDYIGIKRNKMEAIKIYGGQQESTVDEMEASLKIFRNYLSLINNMFIKFDMYDYLYGEPLERLMCLNEAAEFIQLKKETQKEFMGLSRRLKAAYNICFPSGELTDKEVSLGQFFLAIRSIIYKQTRGTAPDAEIMNEVVEKMVVEAIQCTGIENIIDDDKTLDLFSEDFLEQLDQVKLPITKFNALLKLLRKAINDYSKTNRVKALEFSERLKRVVEEYNSRDNLAFVSEVTEDFIDNLFDELIRLMRELEIDRNSFEEIGISYEEKAFYDILVNVRDKYEFPYEDENVSFWLRRLRN